MAEDVCGGDICVELVEEEESSSGGNEANEDWLLDIKNSPLLRVRELRIGENSKN